jgi:hypothetical protein
VAKTNHVSHAGKNMIFFILSGDSQKRTCGHWLYGLYGLQLNVAHLLAPFRILQHPSASGLSLLPFFLGLCFCFFLSDLSKDQQKSTPWTTQFQPWFLVRVKVYLYKCAWGLSEARLPFPSPNSGTKLITSTRNDLHEAGSTEFLYSKTWPSTRFSLFPFKRRKEDDQKASASATHFPCTLW